MLDQQTKQQALFPGLVFNEAGERAEVVTIGGLAHYAVPDAGFLRHVEAHVVDDAVVARIKEQITSMQDEVVRGILQMLGRDDLFTKAAIDASIRNLEQGIRQADPEQWAPALRLFGFRVIVDVHGNVVDVIFPEAPADDDE
ncbi:MAG: hypothetical protein FJZ90_08425 [Chloroflexi bacterium]|nr:hypothetical protein [Chloroflexota bacterium]